MIKLITHNDLDGVGCEILLKLIYGENHVNVSHCSPSNSCGNYVNDVAAEVLKNHKDYDMIYITDISINKELAEKYMDIEYKTVLLDHHKTAKFLNDYSFAKVDTYCSEGLTCGTRMLYEDIETEIAYWQEDSVDWFVETVRRYDTWEWQSKYDDDTAKKLNDLFFIMGIDRFVSFSLDRLNKGESFFDYTTNILLELHQEEIDRYILKRENMVVPMKILGYNAGVVVADRFQSELGNTLAKKHPEYDFIAMVSDTAISYRTEKENVDLSKVAKYFGGGGHEKAAGSPVDKNKVKDFLTNVFEENYHLQGENN